MQDQCISPLDRLDGYPHVRIEKTLIVWQCTIYQQPSPPAIGTGDTAAEAITNAVGIADQRELAAISNPENPQAVELSRPRRHDKHNLLDASTLAAFEEAFWERVNKDGPTVRPELGPCWLWTGGFSQNYGLLRIGGRAIRASRVSWILANRRYPNGPLIMHACDNPPCDQRALGQWCAEEGKNPEGEPTEARSCIRNVRSRIVPLRLYRKIQKAPASAGVFFCAASSECPTVPAMAALNPAAMPSSRRAHVAFSIAASRRQATAPAMSAATPGSGTTSPSQ